VSIDLAPRPREGRSLYVLVPLLILNLALLSIQIEDPRGTLLFKKWVLAVEEPFIRASSGITGGAKYLWTNYFWLRGARRENEELQARVQNLALQVAGLQQEREENSRLRKLLGMQAMVPLQSIGARVVGRTPDYMENTLYLDRGWTSGIAVDDAVLCDNGIIGRVVLVSRNHSQVQLITNADASTGVMVERSRAPGVLKGAGGPLLYLDYISNTEQVNAGDVVVSSGLDGIYPKGLPVGKVTDSQKGKSGFRSIRVEAFADLIRLEDVIIVTGKEKPGQESGVSPPGK
jgi:rod shape-determining protein MreC